MTSPESAPLDPPLVGRLLLLFSAYAPAVLIVGCRTAPATGGWVAVFAGLAGIWLCFAFLWWIPQGPQREVVVTDVEPVDAQVTGYIASYLLPIVAAASPHFGDVVAYVICGFLILVVAFVADLGSVNPVVYVCRLRVVKAKADGHPSVLLVRALPAEETSVVAARRIGIFRVLS